MLASGRAFHDGIGIQEEKYVPFVFFAPVLRTLKFCAQFLKPLWLQILQLFRRFIRGMIIRNNIS